MKNFDVVEQEKKEKIDKAVALLEIINERKKNQDFEVVEEEGDTPPLEETKDEKEDIEERFVMEKLFETLGLPAELSVLLSFEDAESFKNKIEIVQRVIKCIKEESFTEGQRDNSQYCENSREKETPEKQIAYAMGVKVPKFFKSR